MRDTHRRSYSPRARSRSRRRSRSSSSERWSSSDSPNRFSRRSHRSKRHNSRSRSRSRNPRRFERSRHYSHARGRRSAASGSQDAALYGDTFRVSKRREEERGIRPVDSAKAAEDDRAPRRIAPNASALKSIMFGTARSRDRMDERERARAKQKLESLNAAKTSTE